MKTGFCDRVMLDGVEMNAAEARISPLGDGFMFGHGIFETIKVLQGQPVFFAEHAARLERSARELELKVADGLGERVRALIAANGLEEGALKIVIFLGESSGGELLTLRPFFYPAASYEAGFRLKTFPDARPIGQTAALKSLSYLKNRRARAGARALGFDDALFVGPEGNVLESSTANLFIVKAGEVFTPPIESGVLPGIARAIVLALKPGKKVRETPVTEAMWHEADEVFVTNALLGAMPVARIDERAYEMKPDGWTRKIQADFRAAQQRSIGK